MDATNPISTLLREAREERRLSVAELSRLTNIRPHVISAIDAGDFAELPSVYMRSFIKGYAKAVGINEQEVDYLLDTYLASSQQSKAPVTPLRQPPAQPQREVKEKQSSAPNKPYMNRNLTHVGTPPGRKRLYWIFGSVAMLGVLASVYFLYFAPQKNPKSIVPGSLPPTVVSEQDSGSSNGKGGLLSYFNGSTVSGDSVVLEAVAQDTVWISITMDGKQSEQLTLYPQGSKRWTAAEKFVLSVGNAGGVSLTRNGVALPSLGSRGETVRSITIKKNEFLTSASPWKSQRDTTKRKPTTPANTKPSSVTSPSLQKPTAVVQTPKKPVVSPAQQAQAKPQTNLQAKPQTSPSKPQASPSGTTAAKPQTTSPTQAQAKPSVKTPAKPQGTTPTVSTPVVKKNPTLPAAGNSPKPTVQSSASKPAQSATTAPKPSGSTAGANSSTTAKTPAQTAVKPKPKPTTKETAEEKKIREERMRRARQLELTPAPFKSTP